MTFKILSIIIQEAFTKEPSFLSRSGLSDRRQDTVSICIESIKKFLWFFHGMLQKNPIHFLANAILGFVGFLSQISTVEYYLSRISPKHSLGKFVLAGKEDTT